MSRNLLLLTLCLSTLACDVFYPVRRSGYGSGDAGYGSCDYLPSCNPGDEAFGYGACPPGISCYLVSDCGTTVACIPAYFYDAGTLGCDVLPSCLPGDFAAAPYSTCPPNATCYGASSCAGSILCEHFAADAGQLWDGGSWEWDSGSSDWDAGSWDWDSGTGDRDAGSGDAGHAPCDAVPSCFPGDLQVPDGSCSSSQLCYVPSLCGHSITCLHGGASFDAG